MNRLYYCRKFWRKLRKGNLCAHQIIFFCLKKLSILPRISLTQNFNGKKLVYWIQLWTNWGCNTYKQSKHPGYGVGRSEIGSRRGRGSHMHINDWVILIWNHHFAMRRLSARWVQLLLTIDQKCNQATPKVCLAMRISFCPFYNRVQNMLSSQHTEGRANWWSEELFNNRFQVFYWTFTLEISPVFYYNVSITTKTT